MFLGSHSRCSGYCCVPVSATRRFFSNANLDLNTSEYVYVVFYLTMFLYTKSYGSQVIVRLSEGACSSAQNWKSGNL